MYVRGAYELGKWLAETWEWSLFFTLTVLDHQLGPRAGLPRGVGASERLLQQWTKGSIEARGGYWLAGMESHAHRVTPHFHGIAGGFYEEPSRTAMWAEWRALTWEGIDPETGRAVAARAQVVPVDDAMGAAIYTAKYVNKGMGKLYIGGGLEWRKKPAGTAGGNVSGHRLPDGPSGAGKKDAWRPRFAGKK